MVAGLALAPKQKTGEPNRLYAHTVLFDVYVFRGDPVDALAAGATTGELVINAAGGFRELVANVYRPNTQETLLAPLRHVKLVAMNATGMVIEGEVTVSQRDTLKSRADTYKLRWVVKQVGAPAIIDTKKLKQRSARRLAAAAASGFDPRDDDG